MIGIGVYVRHSDEAVKLYMKVFGVELGYHVLNDDGTYYHSELMKDGAPFLSVVERDAPGNETKAQLGIEFETDEEVKKAFELLKDGGIIDMPITELPWSPCAASVIDRFGVWWYLAAHSHKPSDDFDIHEPLIK